MDIHVVNWSLFADEQGDLFRIRRGYFLTDQYVAEGLVIIDYFAVIVADYEDVVIHFLGHDGRILDLREKVLSKFIAFGVDEHPPFLEKIEHRYTNFIIGLIIYLMQEFLIYQ